MGPVAVRLLIWILAGHLVGGMSFAQQTRAAASAAPLATTSSRPSPLLDLNTASASQLRALPGMGDAYVRRVVEGRPYSAKNQLVTRGVLPQVAYERIKDQIVAHRAARP